MIKPNNQAKSPDATFQSSARKAEMVVLEVTEFNWDAIDLRGYPSKSMA